MPASERVAFTLVLRLPGESRLRRALAAIEDPASRSFRHFIGARSFATRFAISDGVLATLERDLRRSAVRVTGTYPQRTLLDVSATAGTVQRLLHVRLARYVDGGGARWRVPTMTPAVPGSMRRAVVGIAGLDTRPRLRAHDVALGGLTPATIARAYDITPLHALGFTGKGMKIAIVSFSDFDPGDPAAYAARFGITGPTPKVIPVAGGTTDTSNAGEAALDIDVVRAVAPDAQILVYEASRLGTAGYAQVISRIVNDRQAETISSSWGQCELGLDPAERTAESHELSRVRGQGGSMFVASGDQGAYDCQRSDLTDHRLSVDWPASSADAVAVGGTRLYLAADGRYVTEGAWAGVLSDEGGGGGITTGDPRPIWQRGKGVLNPFSTGRRELPDVSADADEGTGWAVRAGGAYQEVGGTSAAAPFWAASMALIRQYAASKGVGRLGYVNPILYALASKRQRFPPFHDVRFGGNRYYQATPGWDPATGLGSPDVYNLARDMVAFLKSHSSHRVKRQRRR